MNMVIEHIRYRWYTIHEDIFPRYSNRTHYICYTSFISDTVVLDVRSNPLVFNIKNVGRYAI